MHERKRIVLLATGGTIAGKGEAGRTTGYKAGTITGEDLLASIPELCALADIRVLQICNVNSDDIEGNTWISIANTINELALDESIDGFVVTHGTDTLEETAYFLNLTVKTKKPVVVTGAMRPATALSSDGDINLYQAVHVALHEKSWGRGVLVLFANRIYSACYVTKESTYAVDAVAGGESGCMGVCIDDRVYYYYEAVSKRHTIYSEFNVKDIKGLPMVSVVYFNTDADVGLVSYALNNSKGVVVAGAGCGEYSLKIKDVLMKAEIPVVISSRVNAGIIGDGALLLPESISAVALPPQKAAVLLRIVLALGVDRGEYRRIFYEY